METVELTVSEFDEMMCWAFRYAITRQTYVVGSVAWMIETNINSISLTTKVSIVNDIIEEFERNKELSKNIKSVWTNLKNQIEDTLTSREKELIKNGDG